MNRKIRIYPPVIVTLLAALIFMAAAVVSIIGEAGRQTATQPQEIMQVPPTASLVLAQTGPEITPEPEPENTYPSMIHSRDWDGEDSYLLLKIAMAEAEGESVEGKALVMLVVLNRVWSEEFPDTIEEVIFQENQFSPVAEGGRWWTTEPDAGCYEALELVMDGWDESQGALYFERASNGESWHSRNLEFLYQYGGHKFYR